MGSATANPANSITTSEGIGMQALESAISAKIPGSPASRTKCEIALTSDSEIDARRARGMCAQRYLSRADGQHDASANCSAPRRGAIRDPPGASVRWPMRVWIDLTNSPTCS